MPTILQLRRGTAAQNAAYTGSVGELTVDTENTILRLHDGSTAGGTAVGSSGITPTFGNVKIEKITNTLVFASCKLKNKDKIIATASGVWKKTSYKFD